MKLAVAWPRSLFGRLTLIILAGMVLAQIVGAAIMLRDHGPHDRHGPGEPVAREALVAIRALDLTPPDARADVAAKLSDEALRITVGEAVRAVPQGEPDPRLSASLAGGLGGKRAIAATIIEALATEGEMPRRHHVTNLRLSDGTPVALEQRGFMPDPGPPLVPILLEILSRLAIIVGVALIAVRIATRPLTMLARAADGLGRNLNRPPLPETGPSEVTQAARALNSMQARLKSHIADRTRMLAAISHDLRTPLTRMRLRSEGVTDMGMRGKLLGDIAEMRTMVDDTLAFLAEHAAPANTKVPVDFHALVESVVDDARETGGNARLQGEVAAKIRAYPNALRRCIGNLLENALKFGGQALVTIEETPQHVVVRISDRGPGVAHEMLDRVFEPFVRGDAARGRKAGGVGLGLSIARTIARAHGGDVTLVNRNGGGLDACLSLAKAESAAS